MPRPNLVRTMAFVAAISLIGAGCGTEASTLESSAGPSGSPEALTSVDSQSGQPAPEPDPESDKSADSEQDSSEQESSEPGGPANETLIWAHDQEPPDLHLDDPDNNLTVTSWIRAALIEGLYGIDTSTSYYPELLAEEAEVTVDGDGTATIEYVLRDGLSWSDGTPLTSADVAYTFDIITEGCDYAAQDDSCTYLMGSRVGYDLITSFAATSATEFSIEFAQYFAGWKGLFSEVYAAHAFGEDAQAVNANLADWANPSGVLPSSGPMLFDSWDRGSSMSLIRNDSYHGTNSPDATNDAVALVNGVRIDFVRDAGAQIAAIETGEAHLVMADPNPAFGDWLASKPNFTVTASPGPEFEHWGLNLLNPHLGDPNVRQAILLAADMAQVISDLHTPVFGDTMVPEELGGVYWLTNQPEYVDFQAEYRGAQIEAAEAKLEESGYLRGDSDTYEHPDRGPLRLRVGTTGGNELRESQQRILQEQLALAGIDIVIDNVHGDSNGHDDGADDGADYFSERVFNPQALTAALSAGAEGDPSIWDIAQFAWESGPWPGAMSTAFRCGSSNNPYGFCSQAFDARAQQCDVTVDLDSQADCYNELSEWVTTLNIDPDLGLFILPITQKASIYGYVSNVLAKVGMAPDAYLAGPLANIVDFEFN